MPYRYDVDPNTIVFHLSASEKDKLVTLLPDIRFLIENSTIAGPIADWVLKVTQSQAQEIEDVLQSTPQNS